MAKYSGKIGYTSTVETEPGLWETKTIEKQCYGDLVRNTSGLVSGNSTNDNIRISNNISIVADQFACDNFQHIVYITFNGSKWKVTNVEVAYPRLVLTIGGLYNE